MVIVSACLAGIKCRYNGQEATNKEILKLVDKKQAIPLCPERLGGLPVPRKRAEIVNGGGLKVLAGKAKVITEDGEDVTYNFIQGAEKVLNIAQKLGITHAIMKSMSPSCGCNGIYDGSFSGRIILDDGVCTALLKQNGFDITCI
jgi:uncharacterized protein YbbK (DUF523 family)